MFLKLQQETIIQIFIGRQIHIEFEYVFYSLKDFYVLLVFLAYNGLFSIMTHVDKCWIHVW